MKGKSIYDVLAIIAMIAVPLAPAFFFGHAMYTAVLALLVDPWIAVAIGIAAALGLEFVGILAGHNAVKFWSAGQEIHAAVCTLILLAYVGLGIAGLEGLLGKGVVMFLIAPLVYLMVAMQGDAATAVKQKAQRADTRQAFDLEQLALDRQTDRQIKMEKARAKLTQPTAQPAKVHTVSPELTGKALEVYNVLMLKPGATNTEIGEAVGVSRQYVGQVRKELNGAVK